MEREIDLSNYRKIPGRKQQSVHLSGHQLESYHHINNPKDIISVKKGTNIIIEADEQKNETLKKPCRVISFKAKD